MKKTVSFLLSVLLSTALFAQEIEEITITKKLHKGWNLIGYSGTNALPTPSALSQIWDYVESVKNEDVFYIKDIPEHFNKLDSLHPGEGYQVNVTEECTLEWNILRYNYAPTKPVAVFPQDESIGKEISFDLQWHSSDPENGSLTYTVLFDDKPLPEKIIAENSSSNNIQIKDLEFEKTYYWQVIATDELNQTVKSEVFSFTTQTFEQSLKGTVTGHVMITSGNCMPMLGPGPSHCHENNLSTKLVVTPKAKELDLNTVIIETYSSYEGNYSITLQAGEYSIFVINTTGYEWEIWSEDNNGWNVTITGNQTTTQNINVNNALW